MDSGSPPTRIDPPASIIRRAALFEATSVAGSISVYLPATVAFRLINFARIVLLTWWMPQAEFGLFNIVLPVINVLTPLCSLGLADAVARYAPLHEARGSLR